MFKAFAITALAATALVAASAATAQGFAGGVSVAVGDVNSDGTPDIITGAGPGGGPHVRVIDGTTRASPAPGVEPGELAAPQDPAAIGLLVPAIQKAREAAPADPGATAYVGSANGGVWKTTNGEAPAAGDASGDGTVDASDYNVWRNNFGTAGAAAGQPAGGGKANVGDFSFAPDAGPSIDIGEIAAPPADPVAIGLLLPAIQKVREAAAAPGGELPAIGGFDVRADPMRQEFLAPSR
jgi:hypothetical protein